MIFNQCFLTFVIVVFTFSNAVGALSGSNTKRRGAEAKVTLPTLLISGELRRHPTLGDVFDCYNDPRILGSRLETDLSLPVGEYLSQEQDHRISNEYRAVGLKQSLERRTPPSNPVRQTEVPLIRRQLAGSLDGTVIYTGRIEIGGQRSVDVTVRFDTGAFGTRIASNKCQGIRIQLSRLQGKGQVLVPHDTNREAGPGAVGDETVSSQVNIGGLPVRRHSFTCTHDAMAAFGNFDGTVGLGMSFGKPDNLLDVPYQRGATNGIFAFHLTKTFSRLYVGWIGDKNLFYDSQIEYHDATLDHHLDPIGSASRRFNWMIDKGMVKVNGEPIAAPTGDMYAGLASGIHMMYGPAEHVARIYQRIPGARLSHPHSLYVFPCTAEFTISFSWNGHREWVFTRESLTLKEENGLCFGAIQGGSVLTNTWVLGTSFMEHVRVVFQLPNNRVKARVGFTLYKQLPR